MIKSWQCKSVLRPVRISTASKMSDVHGPVVVETTGLTRRVLLQLLLLVLMLLMLCFI